MLGITSFVLSMEVITKGWRIPDVSCNPGFWHATYL